MDIETDPKFAEELAAAIATHKPLPEFPTGISLEEAYAIQHRVTEARAPGQSGAIKAGVTSPIAQKFLQLDHALLGSLYSDCRLSVGDKFSKIAGRAIECEVAVWVDDQGHPTSIAPAIEVVLVNFSNRADMNASNLVACNLGADLFIVGDPVPWKPDFNETTVSLSRDDETLNKAAMKDAIGGPETATQWMWQEAQKRGFTLGEETLFLTGACGTVVPAEVGNHTADFGLLGTIEFQIISES